METGKVVFFNEVKGYGSIKCDSGEKDISVLATGLLGRIKGGDKVQFETTQGPKGRTATSVKKI